MKLSSRQREIVALIADGLSTKEISRKLELSPKTVDAHLQRVYDRNGIRNRAAIVAKWIREGEDISEDAAHL